MPINLHVHYTLRDIGCFKVKVKWRQPCFDRLSDGSCFAVCVIPVLVLMPAVQTGHLAVEAVVDTSIVSSCLTRPAHGALLEYEMHLTLFQILACHSPGAHFSGKHLYLLTIYC